MQPMKAFTEGEVQGRGMTSQTARDRLVNSLQQKGIEDVRVLQAIARTPRHLFLDSAFASRAYEDIALPIGWQQTLSQPWVVAVMAQALVQGRQGDKPLQRVLEIGTGSGYNAAVLSHLAQRVLSMERITGLHQLATQRMAALAIASVELRLEDAAGSQLKDCYEAVICTAACRQIAPQWLDCLTVGGRLVAPVGDTPRQQRLLLVERTGADSLKHSNLGAVAFVPLLEGVEA